MSNGDERIQGWLQIVASIIGGGAIVGLGKWLLDFLKVQSDRHTQRSQEQESRERTIIAEYQRILDSKDRDHGEERKEWRDELKKIKEENNYIRRENQRYLIEGEAMRARIEGMNREMARVGGSARLLSDTLDAVLMTDMDGNICWANEAASLFLRVPVDELLQRSAVDFVPKSYLEAHRRGLERMKGRTVFLRGEIVERVLKGRVRLADGIEVPAEIYISVFSVSGTMMCRAQIRRRFERPDTDRGEDGSLYVPATASASGINASPLGLSDAPGGMKSDAKKEDNVKS
jgi:PAS domain-containing protein